MRKSSLIVLSPLLVVLGIGHAHAHAALERAEPRVGNTVKPAPRAVSLWFTQNIEAAFSRIEVFDSAGARVDAGKATVDGADRKSMHVPLKPLPPGTYTVRWRVLSVDTHTSEGNFNFHVSP
jgi:copper resistance protein C